MSDMNNLREVTRSNLGANVRRYREIHEISQEGLAERLSSALGVPYSQVTVLRIEKGTRPTNVEELRALALIFDVYEDDLINPVVEVGLRQTEAQRMANRLGFLVDDALERLGEIRELVTSATAFGEYLSKDMAEHEHEHERIDAQQARGLLLHVMPSVESVDTCSRQVRELNAQNPWTEHERGHGAAAE